METREHRKVINVVIKRQSLTDVKLILKHVCQNN